MHSGKKALELLANPFAHEEIENLFAFEIPSSNDFPNEFYDSPQKFCDALLELPAVTCGIQTEEGSNINAVPDVLLERETSEADIELLKINVEKNPTASLALGQLLRLNANLSMRDCLIAESLTYSALQSGSEFQSWLDTKLNKKPDKRLNKRKQSSSVSSQEPAVLVERKNDQLQLTLNRPEKHNAYSAEMRDLLVEALRIVFADSTVEEIIFQANGKSFCSGGDLDEFGTTPDPATAHKIRSLRNTGWWLHLLSNRTKTRVQGACIGAGIELPAFTSYIEATPDAYFNLPEIGLGLIPGAGGTASIPRRIGRQRTAWLALTRDTISAQTALEWGLIDEIA